jgi:hypothetical protein
MGLTQTWLGDFDGQSNGTLLLINDSNSYIASSYNNSQIGLILDFANDQFYLGDAGSGLSSYIRTGGDDIVVVSGTTRVHTFTDDIRYSGSVLTTNNGTAVNQHLKVNINGVAYQIQLRLQ